MTSQKPPFPPSFAPSSVEMTAVLRGLYLSLLGREPDAAGLAHWLRTWQELGDLNSIAASLLASEEYRSSSIAINHMASFAVDRAQQSVRAAAQALAEAPVVIVDVGAQNLEHEEHVYAALDHFGVPHRVVGFEPLENRRHERLQNTGDELSLLSAFIGDGNSHTFHVNEPDATSSLLPFNPAVTELLLELAPLRTVRTEVANTTTLDAALEEEPTVDMLKLDIQGFELTALRHATSVLQRTQVVHCEVSFTEIYEGQALFSEVEQHMRGCGFELADLTTLCRYPFTGTPFPSSRDWLGWGDAVFFRRLPPGSLWRDSLVQSLLALAVYRKPSLAAWLARSLEGTPGANYLNTLMANGMPSV